ncbi:hypothetical protein PsorP6_003616 [Peronosclerospora sorghi]|uniref:Uncharacterized protein n=1 Tax=Peronosclerospora sorghi TaxID=230839 RepID=A0ACC0VLE7_9STRA|nr:hypothetical protein PsorP6_003616 [Peronosclerospora sorghi]
MQWYTALQLSFSAIWKPTEIRWMLASFCKNREHNYGPSMDIAGNPSACRLQPAQRTITEQIKTTEIAPKDILESLSHVNPQTRAIGRTIYNEKRCVELALKYPYFLVMDCTYKTNRFRMPMFHVIGITSFNTSFTVAVPFIREETEP